MQIGFSFSHFFYDLSFIMEFENISPLKLTNTTNIYFYFVWEKKEQTLNEKKKKSKQREMMAFIRHKNCRFKMCPQLKWIFLGLCRSVSNTLKWMKTHHIIDGKYKKNVFLHRVKVKTKCDIRCKYFVSFSFRQKQTALNWS